MSVVFEQSQYSKLPHNAVVREGDWVVYRPRGPESVQHTPKEVTRDATTGYYMNWKVSALPSAIALVYRPKK